MMHYENMSDKELQDRIVLHTSKLENAKKLIEFHQEELAHLKLEISIRENKWKPANPEQEESRFNRK